MAPSIVARSSAGMTSADVMETGPPPRSWIIFTCSGFQVLTFSPLTSLSDDTALLSHRFWGGIVHCTPVSSPYRSFITPLRIGAISGSARSKCS